MTDILDEAAQSAVETDTTDTISPQVEEQGNQAQTEQGETPEVNVDDFPTDVAEQRKAFQEQRLEIKRLKEERETKVEPNRPSAFAAFRPQSPQAGVVNIQQFTDPNTGDINLDAYNAAVLSRAESVATQKATQAVTEQLDEANARSKYPDLFKDADIEREIADRWLAAKVRGEEVTVVQVADQVNKRFSKAVSNAEKAGMERALTEVTPKEAAALAVTGQTRQSRQSGSDAEHAKLVNESRMGGLKGENAVAARLAGIPWKS